jgi:hypothetical protein
LDVEENSTGALMMQINWEMSPCHTVMLIWTQSPHRGAVPGASTFIFNESSRADMDLSGDNPSPSTINS